MNGWGGGNEPMPNYVGDYEMEILRHLQNWQPPFVWSGADGGGVGVRVSGVGVDGGPEVGSGSARTSGKLSVSFQNQHPLDNPQPGPSTATSPKSLPRNIPATSTKATHGKAVQMIPTTSSDRLANSETDSSSMSTEDAQRRSRQILVGWDTFRSRTMLILLVMLVIWAAIYFPLILT